MNAIYNVNTLGIAFQVREWLIADCRFQLSPLRLIFSLINAFVRQAETSSCILGAFKAGRNAEKELSNKGKRQRRRRRVCSRRAPKECCARHTRRELHSAEAVLTPKPEKRIDSSANDVRA